MVKGKIKSFRRNSTCKGNIKKEDKMTFLLAWKHEHLSQYTLTKLKLAFYQLKAIQRALIPITRRF